MLFLLAEWSVSHLDLHHFATSHSGKDQASSFQFRVPYLPAMNHVHSWDWAANSVTAVDRVHRFQSSVCPVAARWYEMWRTEDQHKFWRLIKFGNLNQKDVVWKGGRRYSNLGRKAGREGQSQNEPGWWCSWLTLMITRCLMLLPWEKFLNGESGAAAEILQKFKSYYTSGTRKYDIGEVVGNHNKLSDCYRLPHSDRGIY